MSKKNAIDDGSCKGHVIRVGKRKGKWSPYPKVAVQACETAHGPRPHKYVVRHLCVNDSNVGKRGEDAFVCIHPEHIEWSTHKQNMQDAAHNISAAVKGKPTGPHNKPRSDKGMSNGQRGIKRNTHPNKPRKLKAEGNSK